MTREEAIETLINHTQYKCNGDDLIALDIAIKALEHPEQNVIAVVPCGDVISRQAAVEAFQMFREYESNRSNKGWVNRIETVLNQLPPVTPQQKTGHWIDIMVGDMPAQACDRCNTFYPLAYTGGGHKYCPNCGCRMVEPQESEE